MSDAASQTFNINILDGWKELLKRNKSECPELFHTSFKGKLKSTELAEKTSLLCVWVARGLDCQRAVALVRI
jgi:hypothetical protein